MKTVYENIVEKLYQEYSVHGFISENRVFEVIEKNGISLLDSDAIVDKLLLRGVIIRDDMPFEQDEDDGYDRGKYDYETLYKSVLEIAPELEDLVEYIRKIQAPQHREWQTLLPQAQSGNDFARKRIFEMYMRSVLRLAFQFSQKYYQPLEDTLQNGFLGLYISIDKFEYGRQDNFSQYYSFWVLQQIRREIEMVNPTVYYPAHVKDQFLSVFDIISNHYCGLCDSYTICPNLQGIIKKELKCDDEFSSLIINSMRPFDSFDELLDNDFEIEDIVFSLDKIVEEDETKQAINSLLFLLSKREAEVIRLRYGFYYDTCYTLEQVGSKYNVTRERIRQIESKALKRLAGLSPKKLKEFL